MITARGRRFLFIILAAKLFAAATGHWIHAARIAWVALNDPLNGHPAALYWPMHLNRFNRVGRTAWPEAAARA